MGLETASFVANLVVTNPDGGDARSTADDHLRLIKAALVRTFPKLDSAISLSAAQVHFVGDLSASVQAQLNALRDGSATVNSALYANSAGNTSNLGGVPAATYLTNNQTAQFDAALTQVARFYGADAYFSWFQGSTRLGYVQMTTGGQMILNAEASTGSIILYVNGTYRFVINSDGTLTIPGLITGTITQAQNATSASFATNASVATTATTATTATNATYAATCTSASSAALLSGYAAQESAVADTIVKRNSAGDVFGRYLNQSSGQDNTSVGHVACMTNLDGYWRPSTVAQLGSYLEARNITGRSGIAKTLSTSAPSGGNNGDIHYRY